jgi:hypothetical protein
MVAVAYRRVLGRLNRNSQDLAFCWRTQSIDARSTTAVLRMPRWTLEDTLGQPAVLPIEQPLRVAFAQPHCRAILKDFRRLQAIE